MDYINAEIYANHCTRVYMHNKFLKSHPHIFRHSTLEERQATSKDYYIPPKIASQCVVSKVSFDEIGCQKVACFPKTRNLEICEKDQDTIMLPIGRKHTMACQPACRLIPNAVDTDFRKGKCYISNVYKKAFALFPEHVDGVETVQPIHFGFDLEHDHLYMNYGYCSYYGLNFKRSTYECEASAHQTVLETIFGSSFYRYHIRSNYKAPTYTAPSIPDYMKNDDAWLEGTPPPKRRNKRSTVAVNSADIAEDLVREIAVDYSLDITLQQLSRLFRKRIPKTLQNISAKLYTGRVASRITKMALADVAMKSHFDITAKVSKLVGRGFSVASGVFTVYSIIAFIVDLFDPFNFFSVLDRERLEKINNILDFQYFKNHNKQVEFTPEEVWFLLEEDISEYATYKIIKMQEYMDALTPDQLPLLLKTKTAGLKKEKLFEFVNSYRLIITIALVLLGAILLEQIAYVIFTFLIFHFILAIVNLDT